MNMMNLIHNLIHNMNMMCNDDVFIVVLAVCGQGPQEHCYARVNIDIHNTDCNMLQYSQIRSH